MLTTGLFTVHKFRIVFKKYNEPIYLIPFGDVHRSSDLCSVQHWEDFLNWARSKRRAFFLGMGDYDDLISTSERAVLRDESLHESTQRSLETMYMGSVKRFAKEIGFMQGRLIGLLEGNHYATFCDGTTSTQRLCQILQTKYLGVCSMIRIQFCCETRPSSQLSIDVFAHHGRGAARLIGGSLNRVQQMAESVEADIHLMGHDHRKSVGMTDRLLLLGPNPVTLTHRKLVFARTGSFLKGYIPDKPSYIADTQLSPTNLGVVKIELTPRRNKEGGKDTSYVDIHASI